jgi:hypothetical protein
MFDQPPDYSPDAGDASAALFSWDDGEPIPDQFYQRMIGHPAFPDAVRAMAEQLLALSASDRAIDGIFKDAGRYIAAASAAAMASGVTLAGIKRLCAKFGLLSPGRARAMLLYLRYLGYVSLRRERPAGRPARYRISPAFRAAWQAHLTIVLNAAGLIEPAAAQAAERLDEPAFFECFCRLQLDGLAEGIRHWDPDMPFVRVFINRHAGTQIVWALLVQHGDGGFPYAGPLAVSKSALARRFGVSLMHVKRLFADAISEGLIEQDEGHRPFLTDSAGEQIRFLYAAQLIRLLMTAARTIEALAQPEQGMPPLVAISRLPETRITSALET